jgi:hypothetical protein
VPKVPIKVEFGGNLVEKSWLGWGKERQVTAYFGDPVSFVSLSLVIKRQEVTRLG